MGLVKFALKFRVTFYVLSLLIAVLGGVAAWTMPKDVFPNVDIPVVSVIWTYQGLSADEMEKRVTTYTEFAISNNVNGIKNIESQTLQGVAVEKVYFQPDVNIDLAISQVTSAMNSIRSQLPPGINPPIIVRFSASSVPVIQLALSGEKQSEQQLYDYGQFNLRQQLIQAPGSTIPSPYGGRQRQIMVDLDLQALQARGMTPYDVTKAVTAQNVTVPSGLAKLGTLQHVVRLNSSPEEIDAFNQIPIRTEDGATVLMRDVANVRDGYPVQQNIVRLDGVRGALLTILKNGTASTLSVVDNVKSRLEQAQASAPEGLTIKPLFDQSVFVSTAIDDVIKEGVIAAGLTGLMILVFLGSWRSTVVVLVAIPLSVLTSIAILGALGQTLNIMTLGGLALAIGILVDDSTVAVENTYRLLEEGKPFREAVVEGAAGVARPALVATLTICAAFVSVFFLADAAAYLFIPQAMAVVFAVLASYAVSRTLVPIFIDVLVKNERHGSHKEGGEDAEEGSKKPGVFARFHAAFERGFEAFRDGYLWMLEGLLAFRARTAVGIVAVLLGGGTVFAFTGQDYFPKIDAGQIQLHVRPPAGLRIEDSEKFFQQVGDVIREVVPEEERELILDNIGLPQNNYNLAFSDGSTVAYNDGQILVALKENHAPTAEYQRKLREVLRERFPEAVFYFQPADIVTQILNFGLPAAINVQVQGKDRVGNRKVAEELVEKIRLVKGAADVHIQQILDAPSLKLEVDRTRAQQAGLSEQEIAANVNISLSSSFQVSPNFWPDPKTGIPYQVAVQTPERAVSSVEDLMNTPIAVWGGTIAGLEGTTLASTGKMKDGVTLLSNVATLKRGVEQTVLTHANTQPAYDVYADVQDRDLGSVERDIRPIVEEAQKKLKPGNKIVIRGQIESKNDAFLRIGIGLAAALLFVYGLMVINFQDWGDPFVVMLALPVAFVGVVCALFVTGTSLSIPSLMGAIMSIGVASANSILLVTFAREHRQETGCSALEAAMAAGKTRLRPVLMTAGAMFVGLLPMALGLGAGSEQNAALARAVMGGLAFGTASTLFVVPFFYALLRQGQPRTVEDYA